MPDNQLTNLNPEIPEVEIGIRNLRKVKIYPLSLADELTLKGTISGVLSELISMDKNPNDLTILNFVINAVAENIGKIVPMIMEGETEEVLKEITNYQALEIAGHVYKQNFEKEVFEKKLEALFGPEVLTVAKESLSGRS